MYQPEQGKQILLSQVDQGIEISVGTTTARVATEEAIRAMMRVGLLSTARIGLIGMQESIVIPACAYSGPVLCKRGEPRNPSTMLPPFIFNLLALLFYQEAVAISRRSRLLFIA